MRGRGNMLAACAETARAQNCAPFLSEKLIGLYTPPGLGRPLGDQIGGGDRGTEGSGEQGGKLLQ